MSTIALRELPSADALRHFDETLRTGGANDSVLSEILAREGKFYALAPGDVELARLIQFDAGGLIPAPPKQKRDGYLIQAVADAASSAALILCNESKQLLQPVLWIHEPLLTEGELTPQPDIQSQHVGSELYLIYRGDWDSPAQIEKLLRRSLLSWHFLALLADGVSHAGSIAEVLQRTALVLVGSYDGESFLVWNRTSNSAQKFLTESRI